MAFIVAQGFGLFGNEAPLGWNIRRVPRFFCESTIALFRGDEASATLKRRDEVTVDLGENCQEAQ